MFCRVIFEGKNSPVSGRAGRGLKAESPTQEMLRDVPFVLNLVLWVIVIVAIVYRLRPSA